MAPQGMPGCTQGLAGGRSPRRQGKPTWKGRVAPPEPPLPESCGRSGGGLLQEGFRRLRPAPSHPERCKQPSYERPSRAAGPFGTGPGTQGGPVVPWASSRRSQERCPPSPTAPSARSQRAAAGCARRPPGRATRADRQPGRGSGRQAGIGGRGAALQLPGFPTSGRGQGGGGSGGGPDGTPGPPAASPPRPTLERRRRDDSWEPLPARLGGGGRGVPAWLPEGGNQPGRGRGLAAPGGASERSGASGCLGSPAVGGRCGAGPGTSRSGGRVAGRPPPSPPLRGQRRVPREERGVQLPAGALAPALAPALPAFPVCLPAGAGARRAPGGQPGRARSSRRLSVPLARRWEGRSCPGAAAWAPAHLARAGTLRTGRGSRAGATSAREGALAGVGCGRLVLSAAGAESLAKPFGRSGLPPPGALGRPALHGRKVPPWACTERFLEALSHSGGSEQMKPPAPAYQKLKAPESPRELLPLAEQLGQTLDQFHGSALGRPCHSPVSGLRPAEPPRRSTSLLPWDFQCLLVTAILSTVLVVTLVVHSSFFPLHGLAALGHVASAPHVDHGCSDSCRSVLVESIPEGVTYDDNSTAGPSTFETWQSLLRNARRSVDIASFYWTLSNQDTHTQDPSASQGQEILDELLQATSRGIALRIAVNPPSARMPSADLQLLEKSGAQIRQVDLPRLTRGVLHAKFWIVDQLHIYLGSANMDWRALTQVKELGAAVYNCSCLAQDLGKMFEAYWTLGLPNATIPSPWPANYSTTYNKETPMELQLNGTEAAVYFSSAPPALCASGRTDDLQSLLSIIDGAQEFVYVAVMSYLPTMEFSHPRRFWPAIDDHFRKVVYEKRIRLRLLVGCWGHSKPNMFPFLRSLAALQDNRTHYSLEVRLFVVPANETQAKIPYARVNHSKFMVTDKVAYIGTSNWSGDYFLHTAGSALVVAQRPGGDQTTLREQLQRVFERDWHSRYSRPLDPRGQGAEALCSAR